MPSVPIFWGHAFPGRGGAGRRRTSGCEGLGRGKGSSLGLGRSSGAQGRLGSLWALAGRLEITVKAGVCGGAAAAVPALCNIIAAAAPIPAGTSGGGGSKKVPSPLGKGVTDLDPERRSTDIFLITNMVVYALQLLTRGRLTLHGAKINDLIKAGQWYRLVSPIVLHGGLIHLAVNSYSLNNVGPAYENVAGHARLAAVYLGSGVAGNALSYMMSPNPAVGASGAVFGVAGALFAFLVLHRDVLGKGGDRRIENLARIFGINLIYGATRVSGVDNWAHVGGLLGGMSFGWLLGPRLSVVELPTGKRVLVDKPMWPLLASKGFVGREGET